MAKNSVSDWSTTSMPLLFDCNLPSVVDVKGLKLTNTAADTLRLLGAGKIRLFDMVYGAANWWHISALAPGAQIEVKTDYEIDGSAGSGHLYAGAGSKISCVNKVVTLTGTPNWGSGIFGYATAQFAFIELHASTFSGSATGKRYTVRDNGVIYTSGGGATFLPGDVAGVDTTGGQYV